MSKKALILTFGALALAGAGGGGAYFLTKSGAVPAPEPAEKLGMIALDPFLANVAGEGARRHARVAVTLVVSPQERAAELAADKLAMARLRDQVLARITAKSAGELTSLEGKTALRGEIVDAARPIVAPGAVKEALFVELVVQ